MIAHYKSFDEYISAHGKAEELKFSKFKDVEKKPKKEAVKKQSPKKTTKKAKKDVQAD